MYLWNNLLQLYYNYILKYVGYFITCSVIKDGVDWHNKENIWFIDNPVSRAERIQQLRADHQRRHLERHGHYPSEDKEEEYERQIQEEERRVSSLCLSVFATDVVYISESGRMYVWGNYINGNGPYYCKTLLSTFGSYQDRQNALYKLSACKNNVFISLWKMEVTLMVNLYNWNIL